MPDRSRLTKAKHWPPHLNLAIGFTSKAIGTGQETALVSLPHHHLSCGFEQGFGAVALVRGRIGMMSFVWIVFDTAQLDGDGDGPYRAGEVELEFVAKEAVREEPAC